MPECIKEIALASHLRQNIIQWRAGLRKRPESRMQQHPSFPRFRVESARPDAPSPGRGHFLTSAGGFLMPTFLSRNGANRPLSSNIAGNKSGQDPISLTRISIAKETMAQLIFIVGLMAEVEVRRACKGGVSEGSRNDLPQSQASSEVTSPRIVSVIEDPKKKRKQNSLPSAGGVCGIN
jgi:hypothetical protein